MKLPILLLYASILISISYFLFDFPDLEDDLTEEAVLSFFFFLSFFFVSDVCSGEVTAGLFTGSEILENNLEQGALSRGSYNCGFSCSDFLPVSVQLKPFSREKLL